MFEIFFGAFFMVLGCFFVGYMIYETIDWIRDPLAPFDFLALILFIMGLGLGMLLTLMGYSMFAAP